MTRKDDDEIKEIRRWRLLPEARRHRVLFFVVLIIVLVVTLSLVVGW